MRAVRGFTLLEILVVVALIGLTAVLVVVNISGGGEEGKLQTEAERLVALIKLVQEETELTGQELGLRVEEDGYLWVALADGGRWLPLEYDRFLTQRTLDEAMVLKLELENLPFVEEGERLTETGGLFEDKPLFEAEDDEQKFEPQILILPGGEMTPFRISLLHQDLELEWWLEGNELGELRLLPPGVEADDDPNVPFDNTSPGMSERERAQRAAAEAER